MREAAAVQRNLASLPDDVLLSLQPPLKDAFDSAMLFRITAKAMVEASDRYLSAVTRREASWKLALETERKRREAVEKTLEELATQNLSLERRATFITNKHASSRNSEQSIPLLEEDDEFYDADEFEVFEDDDAAVPPANPRPPTGGSTASTVAVSSSTSSTSGALVPVKGGARQHRVRIPFKPKKSYSLWGTMKNCIGKDLSKIPMPVFFNEPLSFLQRLCEDLEYSTLIDRACKIKSSTERMCYIAAFTMSSYAETTTRTGKPFNPILGETYELDMRDSLGWRCVTEQVCHHPPISAQYAESVNNWSLEQEFSMKSKFRGKYLQIVPTGVAVLRLHETGDVYSWRKVTTTIHNIIVGKLWIDQSGEMTITNHKTGDKCDLSYVAYSYFSREKPRRVSGVVKDANGVAVYELTGWWDESMQMTPAGQPDAVPTVLWERTPLPAESHLMYGYTTFACLLNEEEPGVPRSDSRKRPDQRLMENGLWDEANLEKLRLEEKQRVIRRDRESRGEEFQAQWFAQLKSEDTGFEMWHHKPGYWEARENPNDPRFPDIF